MSNSNWDHIVKPNSARDEAMRLHYHGTQAAQAGSIEAQALNAGPPMPPYAADERDPLGGRPASINTGQLQGAFEILQKSIDTMVLLDQDLENVMQPVMANGRRAQGESPATADASPETLGRSPTVASILAVASKIEAHNLRVSMLIERVTT